MAVEFYRYSYERAEAENDIEKFKDSIAENKRCVDYINDENTGFYQNAYKDYIVDKDGVYTKSLIEQFGMERVMYLFASTVNSHENDPRISNDIREWAKGVCNSYWDVHDEGFRLSQLHVGVVNILAGIVRDEYKALNLFDKSHCIEGDLGKIEGKVFVLSPKILKEKYWAPENQLWLATGGFGCDPNKIGRAVYATCLSDGEQTRWNRENIIGVIKPDCMPKWAEEKLAEITNGQTQENEQIQDNNADMQQI